MNKWTNFKQNKEVIITKYCDAKRNQRIAEAYVKFSARYIVIKVLFKNFDKKFQEKEKRLRTQFVSLQIYWMFNRQKRKYGELMSLHKKWIKHTFTFLFNQMAKK